VRVRGDGLEGKAVSSSQDCRSWSPPIADHWPPPAWSARPRTWPACFLGCRSR